MSGIDPRHNLGVQRGEAAHALERHALREAVISASASSATNGDQSASGPAAGEGRAVNRILTIGISENGPCGVRDHAHLLSKGLQSEGLACSIAWLSRPERSPH